MVQDGPVLYYASKSVFLLRMLLHRLTLPASCEVTLLVSDSPSFRGLDFDQLVNGGFFVGVAEVRTDQLHDADLVLTDILGSIARPLTGSWNIAPDVSVISAHEWDVDFERVLARSTVTFRTLEISPNQAVEVESRARQWMTYWHGKEYFNKALDDDLISFCSSHSVPILDETSSVSRSRFVGGQFETWSFRDKLNDLDMEHLGTLLRFYRFNQRLSDLSGKQIIVRQSSGFAFFPLHEACSRNPLLGVTYGALVDGDKPTDACRAVVYSDQLALDYFGYPRLQTWVKGHPRDRVRESDIKAGSYGRARDIGALPLELLHLVMGRVAVSFALGIAYGSAGNQDAAAVCNDMVELGQGWHRNLWKVDSLVAAVAFVVGNLGVNEEIWVRDELVPIVKAVGRRKLSVDVHVRSMFEDTEIPSDAFVILDDPRAHETERRVTEILHRPEGFLGAIILDPGNEWPLPDGMDMTLWEARLLNKRGLRGDSLPPKSDAIHLVSGARYVRELFAGWEYSVNLGRTRERLSLGHRNAGVRQAIADRARENARLAKLEDQGRIIDSLDKFRRDVAHFGLQSIAMMETPVAKRREGALSFRADLFGLALRSQDDFNDWLKVMAHAPKTVVTCIAVRDTIGSYLSEDLQRGLERIGVTACLMPPNLWRGYVAVLSDRTAIFEQYAYRSDEAPVTWDGAVRSVQIHLESASWRHGDRAICMIDGRDYAVNHRGLNFLVLNSNASSILDCVAFDTYLPGTRGFRLDSAVRGAP